MSSNTYRGISFQKVASCYLSLVLATPQRGAGCQGRRRQEAGRNGRTESRIQRLSTDYPDGNELTWHDREGDYTLWRAGGECAITSTLTLLQHRLQTPAAVTASMFELPTCTIDEAKELAYFWGYEKTHARARTHTYLCASCREVKGFTDRWETKGCKEI